MTMTIIQARHDFADEHYSILAGDWLDVEIATVPRAGDVILTSDHGKVAHYDPVTGPLLGVVVAVTKLRTSV